MCLLYVNIQGNHPLTLSLPFSIQVSTVSSSFLSNKHTNTTRSQKTRVIHRHSPRALAYIYIYMYIYIYIYTYTMAQTSGSGGAAGCLRSICRASSEAPSSSACWGGMSRPILRPPFALSALTPAFGQSHVTKPVSGLEQYHSLDFGSNHTNHGSGTSGGSSASASANMRSNWCVSR
jgi:hypothetical protein